MSRKRFEEITNIMADIYEKKNNDYGDSVGKSIEEFGYVSLAIRLSDKLNRFKQLINSEAQVTDESKIDTLIDLANYAIIGVMKLEGEIDFRKEYSSNSGLELIQKIANMKVENYGAFLKFIGINPKEVSEDNLSGLERVQVIYHPEELDKLHREFVYGER